MFQHKNEIDIDPDCMMMIPKKFPKVYQILNQN